MAGISISGGDVLFVDVENHPQLRFKLGLVESVAQQSTVGNHLGGFSDIEVVRQYEFVNLTTGGQNIATSQRQDFRFNGPGDNNDIGK